MSSPVRLCCVLGRALGCALGLTLLWSPIALSAPRAKSTPGAKKSAKEISADDGLQKQLEWENQLLGPNRDKKIDLAKIQKLQAAETARREKQDKLAKGERDRKEREAALAAQRKDVRSPSSRDMPSVPEPPTPARPVEKHDDAFVDKLLKDGKSGERKRPAVSNDDVDELLAKAKQDKGASVALKPSTGAGRGAHTDSVDQLLATAENQQAIKTTTKKPTDNEPVSAEAASREAALRAMAESAARAQEERDRARRLAVPDSAMLRGQQTATASTRAEASPNRPAKVNQPQSPGDWKDPFAADTGAGYSRHSKISTAVVPASSRQATPARQPPSVRPPGFGSTDPRAMEPVGEHVRWKDPFDSGAGVKAPPSGPKAKPAAKPVKHPPHWKDPFA